MTDTDGRPRSGEGWPLHWDGVVESVVTTPGPDGTWNVAALGLHAPERWTADEPVTARTWGRTRTWRNFVERGEAHVQFTDDPVDFVEAACSVREEPEPVLDSAAAWVRVSATEVGEGAADDGTATGTRWTDWALHLAESAVTREEVPTLRRGRAAVVEATVAASRLDVPGYDAADLRDRIRYLESVVETAGGERDRRAWERFETLVDWRATGE